MIDMVVSRHDLPDTLARLLKIMMNEPVSTDVETSEVQHSEDENMIPDETPQIEKSAPEATDEPVTTDETENRDADNRG